MRTYVNTFSNVPTKVLTYSHLQSLTQGFGLGPYDVVVPVRRTGPVQYMTIRLKENN